MNNIQIFNYEGRKSLYNGLKYGCGIIPVIERGVA